MSDLHDKEAVRAAALMSERIRAVVDSNDDEGLAAQTAAREFAEKVFHVRLPTQ